MGIVIFLASLLFDGVVAHAASAYAQRCQQVIGVPVPDIDCTDSRSSAVSTGRWADGGCENPAHGINGCGDGSRMLRFTDVFVRDGREETVTTIVLCRKANGHAEHFNDVAVIQYNETKHAACWFAKSFNVPPPRMRVIRDGREKYIYPSPSTETEANRFWGNAQPSGNCLSCHQSGPWLRTPFASSVRPQPGMGYRRFGGTGEYAPADGNQIPYSRRTDRLGPVCSVALPGWNAPYGDGAVLPLKINADAYDRRFPPAPAAARLPAPESSATCTRCHYIGATPSSTMNLSCSTLVPEIESGVNRLHISGTPFARRFWMPPDHGLTTEAEYRARYGRALEAIRWCCDLSHRRDPDFEPICSNAFAARGDYAAELRAVTGPRGACALCSDCVGGERFRFTRNAMQQTH